MLNNSLQHNGLYRFYTRIQLFAVTAQNSVNFCNVIEQVNLKIFTVYSNSANNFVEVQFTAVI